MRASSDGEGNKKRVAGRFSLAALAKKAFISSGFLSGDVFVISAQLPWRMSKKEGLADHFSRDESQQKPNKKVDSLLRMSRMCDPDKRRLAEVEIQAILTIFNKMIKQSVWALVKMVRLPNYRIQVTRQFI